MQPIEKIQGKCVPLPRSDIDTDQIIPSDWLKRVERTGLEAGLFSEWRDDPSFVLNNDLYAEANILVAGPNFGTGSSREHAVWALQQYGFESVVSSKFGDIFKNNSTKCGLVPVEVSQDFVDELLTQIEANPATQVSINLKALEIEVEGGSAAKFCIDPATQNRLLKGLDEITLSLQHESSIKEYEDSLPIWRN